MSGLPRRSIFRGFVDVSVVRVEYLGSKELNVFGCVDDVFVSIVVSV